MKTKPTSCETCGGYCLSCGRPGLVFDSRPSKVFLFVAPYIIVACLGALVSTYCFQWWIPGSLRAVAARSAAKNCQLAADYCKEACK